MANYFCPNPADDPKNAGHRWSQNFPDFSKAPFLSLLATSFEGIAIVEQGNGQLVYANVALASWLDRSPKELMGERLESLLDVNLPQALPELVDSVGSDTSGGRSFPARLLAGNEAVPVEVRLCCLEWDERALIGIVIQRMTVVGRPEEAAAELRSDPLTGLADRSFLFERLQALLHGDRAADRQFAVLFVDLDNFKEVNDSHGHLIGDRALREVAQRLAKCVRTGDHVVRYGGDEFVVLLDRVSAWHEIAPVIQRIHAALEKPIALDDGEAVLSVSIGVAEASPEHQSPEDLLSDADRAMYASKRSSG